MELSNTMLVSIMFVTILSIGIGNILMSIAEFVRPGKFVRSNTTLVVWQVLLLLFHFELFWQSKVLLEIDDIEFEQFILTIAGPILILMATNIILSLAQLESRTDEDMLLYGRRFFALYALLQVWMVATDYLLGDGYDPTHILNYLIIALVVALLPVRSSLAKGLLSWSAMLIVAVFVLARALSVID